MNERLLGRLIGIDHGLARIGVAVSDAAGISAHELTIIVRTSKRADFEKLNAIAREQNAVAYIVGVPYSDTPPDIYTQADRVRTWIGHFSAATDLPIVEWDESLSSDDARQLAIHQRRKPTDPIDDLAARIILQRYLDALHDGLATPPPRRPPLT